MAPLLTVHDVSKQFGSEPLFNSISLTISPGSHVGLIGPNGAGKSTLLGIIAGEVPPDSGNVIPRKGATVRYVAQDSAFPPGVSVRQVLHAAAEPIEASERLARVAEISGRSGFTDVDVIAATLSGGWKKRLAIAEALVSNPDLLLLDEPTNHLDIEGIAWLEKLLRDGAFASVAVSHDRYFLENAASEIIELNHIYSAGLFRVDGSYSKFLEAKEAHLLAQSKHREALENRVRTELAWLRRGPKARATKSKARIDRAHEMIGDLSDLTARERTAQAGIEFIATDRRTKRLIVVENLRGSIGGRTLFRDLSFNLIPKHRIGLVGPNGSGKSTLLHLLQGQEEADSGTITRAPDLKVVYFDQHRAQLDLNLTLRRALAPDGDSVVFGDRVLHVASWADRFLFAKEQLDQPMNRLSGGERARVLIANLMRQPADVLLLDEPTNDLDIETLEILEENLLEFQGALVLVTHDRFLLDRVATTVIGLDGNEGAGQFADYRQWEDWLQSRRVEKKPSSKTTSVISNSSPKKLSYLEARELGSMEERITEAERIASEKQERLSEPDVTRDGRLLQQAYEEQQAAQRAVDTLYARWSELEDRQSSGAL